MKCIPTSKSDTERYRQAVSNENCDTMILAFASVLTDKLHFGKTKTLQTLKQVMTRFEDMESKIVSKEDWRDILNDEYDINIKRYGRG